MIDKRCDSCAYAKPFVVVPGVGPQSAERTRKCEKHGLSVGVEYTCAKWKKIA